MVFSWQARAGRAPAVERGRRGAGAAGRQAGGGRARQASGGRARQAPAGERRAGAAGTGRRAGRVANPRAMLDRVEKKRGIESVTVCVCIFFSLSADFVIDLFCFFFADDLDMSVLDNFYIFIYVIMFKSMIKNFTFIDHGRDRNRYCRRSEKIDRNSHR